jgi:hypothetical protein
VTVQVLNKTCISLFKAESCIVPIILDYFLKNNISKPASTYSIKTFAFSCCLRL